MIKDCNKKEKKCCGISKIVIPAALGDENGEYRPQNGAYSNTLVEYQASGVSYLYSNDGIPTRMGDGIVATIEVGETTTLQPGESATVENIGDKYHAVLNFGIPEGQKGDTGDAATIEVGATTTSAPGSDASVTNSGDEHNAVLDFVIPRGSQGPQGVPGQAATIQVGTVTTLDPDQDVTVVNSGTTSAAVFDFGIPKGDKGDTGSVSSEVVTELPVPGDDSKLYLMEKDPTVETADGAEFTIQNAATDGEMKLVEVDGNATQNGTPTPDAPIAVNTTTGENVVMNTGKNLLDKSVGFTNKWINSNGNEVAGNTNALFNGYIKVAPNTAYTISFKSSVYNMIMSEWNESKTFVKQNIKSVSTSYTITTQATTEYLRINFNYNGSTTVTQDIIDSLDIQLELGSTATAYEPYQGQEFEVNLGKNLFDKDNAPIAHLLIGTTSLTTTSSGGATYIPVVGGQTYTFSRQNTTDQVGDATYCFTSELPTADVPTIGRTVFSNRLTFTATAPDNAKYLVIYFAWAKSDTVIRTIFETYQIEVGSQATTYAPYFTPIELAKIGDYQDKIYKEDSKWYIEKQVGKVVLDGTQTITITNWRATETSVGWIYPYSLTNNACQSSSDHASPVLSNNFTTHSYADLYNKSVDNGIATFNGSSYGIVIRAADTSLTSASAINAWLSTHPTTVYYALATPTTTEITDSTLLSQLNFIANLYGGTNNIMLVGTGAQGEIGVEYQTWEKYNRYDVYIWNDQIDDYQILNS